ncbi:MAG: RsmG family class I SAM-dependent methyltransferase [Actinomycetota bacterium]
MKHQGWEDELAALGITLDTTRLESLLSFREALRQRAIPKGFVGSGDAERLWERHIRDSLRALPEIPPGSRVADLGSGAGLPGLPLAIAAPSSSFALIELRRGRVAFLEAVVDDLGLANVEVHLGKAEGVSSTFDFCLARAFSSASGSWLAAVPHLEQAGRLIYWAGSGFQGAELAHLEVSWRVSTPSGLADSGPLVIMSQQ